jgi:hypothetical protein
MPNCPATYASADLYLWPAINEAYGMAFLEAQAAGLPVVAGRTGGVPAVVADGVTGVLTPIGDAAAFAAATARLLDDPKARAQLGKAARARVECPARRARRRPRAGRGLEDAAMSVPFAVLRHASTDWNVERRLQGLDRHPAQRRRRGRCPRLAPAVARRRLEAAQQPLAACPPHRRAAAAIGAGHRRLGAARDELRHLGRPYHRRAARERGRGFHCLPRTRGLDFQPPGGESPRAAMAASAVDGVDRRRLGSPSSACRTRPRSAPCWRSATGWDMMGRPPHKLDWRCLHFFSAHADGRVSVDRLNVPL